MQSYTKMRSRKFPDVIMKVIPGHFVTPNSHINYYIDMTTMKTRQSEAKAAARAMASTYAATTIVDTIVCMDGMEVIGAYLADELTQAGIMSMNAHKTIYVYSPEFDNRGQMIFRENSEMMIKGKHVLLLLASATTGQTILRAGESIDYYGGTVVGITWLPRPRDRRSSAQARASTITAEPLWASRRSSPFRPRSSDSRSTRCTRFRIFRITEVTMRRIARCARTTFRSTRSATVSAILNFTDMLRRQ